MRHLPAQHRERPAWRHVAAELEKAVDAFVALRLVLMLENVVFSRAARVHAAEPEIQPRATGWASLRERGFDRRRRNGLAP